MSDLLNVVRGGWDFIARQESSTSGVVYAGDLVEESGGNIQAHSTDGGNVDTPTFAKDMRGRGVEAGDEYPAGEFISYLKCNGAAILMARLADGETVTEGETRLVSAGDGTLRAFNSDDEGAVVAVADEDLNNTSGSPSLVAIEVTA